MLLFDLQIFSVLLLTLCNKNVFLTQNVTDEMSESGKRIFTSAGISSSLDTVLATAIGTNFNNRLSKHKKSNSNLLSDKSLSNNSSKSSSGSSLTLTNNNKNSPEINVPSIQFPHHQFYSSQQISTSANWNNINIRSNSICSQQKVSLSVISHLIIRISRIPTQLMANYSILSLLVLIDCANNSDSRDCDCLDLLLARESQQQIFKRYAEGKNNFTSTQMQSFRQDFPLFESK